jgi:hypothetical protein
LTFQRLCRIKSQENVFRLLPISSDEAVNRHDYCYYYFFFR